MYRKSVLISLVLVYLVIIAGAVVRMTGSGMGCPDWPKCFGYMVPPTERSQLEFQADHTYEQGQVIIHNETLQVAGRDFKTKSSFDPKNWSTYEKHDYAIFNPWHTWIEYINRLLGALGGLAVFVMAMLSLRFWKKSKKITLLSWAAVLLMGFQGWLGATVVYSVLAPVRITIHMVVALLIVILLIYLLNTVQKPNKNYDFSPGFKWRMIAVLALTALQILLGTQVRQHVDETVHTVGYAAKSLWLADADITFYIHRSFAILVFLANAYLLYENRNNKHGHMAINWVFGLIILEILTGVIMYYLDFPFLTQPIHLVIAAVIFGLQSYILLTAFKQKKSLPIG